MILGLLFIGFLYFVLPISLISFYIALAISFNLIRRFWWILFVIIGLADQKDILAICFYALVVFLVLKLRFPRKRSITSYNY